MKKKIIGAVLAALMLGGAVTVGALDTSEDVIVLNSENEYTLDLKIHLIGDVTGDGKVNISDYLKVLAHAKAPTSDKALIGYAFECGDVNADGKINITDYLKVLSQAKGKHTLW